MENIQGIGYSQNHDKLSYLFGWHANYFPFYSMCDDKEQYKIERHTYKQQQSLQGNKWIKRRFLSSFFFITQLPVSYPGMEAERYWRVLDKSTVRLLLHPYLIWCGWCSYESIISLHKYSLPLIIIFHGKFYTYRHRMILDCIHKYIDYIALWYIGFFVRQPI